MVGLGCNPCKAEIVSLAIDLGITLFDTSELYDEEEVGRGIAGKRDKVFLVSKVAPEHLYVESLQEALHNSLKRLGTDYLDLYMVHWPNPNVVIEATLSVMRFLKDCGKVRHIGLCNCDIVYLREASKWTKIDYIEVEYNLVDRTIENGILQMCKANGIKVLAYSPLKWTDYKWIELLAEERHITREQIVLQFLVEQGVIPIPSTTNEQHLRDIASAEFYMPQYITKEISSFYPGQPTYRLPSTLICDGKLDVAINLPADIKPIKVRKSVVVDGKKRFLAWKQKYGDLPIPTLEVL